MDNNIYNAVEEAKGVAPWRARSPVEMGRLRTLIHDEAPLAVYRTTDNSSMRVFTTPDKTAMNVSVSITEFPCIAAHLQCCGGRRNTLLAAWADAFKKLAKVFTQQAHIGTMG